MHVSAVDIFCGVGGLTLGLREAGISVEAGIDLDPACEYSYSLAGATFVKADVEELARNDASGVARLFSPEADVRLLAGCAPCQPFSPLTQGRDQTSHPQWSLLRSFGHLVRALRPEIVTMENVCQLRFHEVFVDFVDLLTQLGYNVNSPENMRVDCPQYGVPQHRRRLVLLASRLGPIELRSPDVRSRELYPSVRQAIGHLPPIEAGEVHPDDPLHRAQGLSDTNLRRIRRSKPGGSWRDWDEALRLDCHKGPRGASYTPVYGRMEWDKPAPTITTQFYNYGSGRFGHPEQDRPISLREGALLQGFPADLRFASDEREASMDTVGRLIGNAVPPPLGTAIGESVLRHVKECHAS